MHNFVNLVLDLYSSSNFMNGSQGRYCCLETGNHEHAGQDMSRQSRQKKRLPLLFVPRERLHPAGSLLPAACSHGKHASVLAKPAAQTRTSDIRQKVAWGCLLSRSESAKPGPYNKCKAFICSELFRPGLAERKRLMISSWHGRSLIAISKAVSPCSLTNLPT